MNFTPHQYQQAAIDFVSRRLGDERAEGAALWLDPGLGKTAITLRAIERLRADHGLGRRVLVIAPLRVIYSVWPAEVRKWGFRFSTSIVHGSANQRRKALDAPADIYLLNPEGVPWLMDEFRARPQQQGWDLTVLDESTKFKSWTAQRTKALRVLVPKLGSRLELTGTPAPNHYGDLFAQIYFLDRGEALGKTLTRFRDQYCYLERGGSFHRWALRDSAGPAIESQVAPLVLRMNALDHLDLPALVTNPIWVDLPTPIHREYRRLEQQLFAELAGGATLVASSGGGKYAHCRSVANGGCYLVDPVSQQRKSVHVHDAKVNAVQDLLEDLGGKPLLVAYQFHHDRERLLRVFPEAPTISGGTSAKESTAIIERWNRREIPILLVQPQALSHGANMQRGGNDICWFGCSDQPEIHTQFNARLYRQGVEGQVRIHYLLARRTVDEAIFARLQDKDRSQAALLRAVEEYRIRMQEGTR